MPFPKSIKEQAAVACNRCCCICHEFKGIKLEFHHIKQEADGGENTYENCIPLCFDCHADMGGVNPKHPKGNAYSEAELKMHRDNWYRQCSNSTSRLVDVNNDTYGEVQPSNTVKTEMLNASGGHTVIIDDEKYISQRIVDEQNKEIEKLLSEI